MTTPTITPVVPFYANQPCRVCARPMTAEGVFVTDDQRWCRPCSSTLRDLLNATLPVVQI